MMPMLAACPTPEPGGEGFVVTGVIQDTPPQVPTQVMVLWSTETSTGDAIYKFGEGTVEGATFSATIPGPLPAEARNYGDVGVAWVALMPADVDVPNGLVDVEDLESYALGLTSMEAVVWRDDATTTHGPPWTEAFPKGYACGDCIDQLDVFDGFAVGACNDLTIHVFADFEPDELPWCQWS